MTELVAKLLGGLVAGIVAVVGNEELLGAVIDQRLPHLLGAGDRGMGEAQRRLFDACHHPDDAPARLRAKAIHEHFRRAFAHIEDDLRAQQFRDQPGKQ